MVAFTDLVLLPHCDLHAVRTGPTLSLRLFTRLGDDENPPLLMPMTPVLPVPAGGAPVTFQFFAPHRPVGHRLDPAGLPTVNPATGEVTVAELGVFLFQVAVGGRFMVGRLQVHERIENWWFGNSSITTAVHPTVPHAQPSIFARFSADTSGADLVGDITGHRFVALTSGNTAVLDVVDNDRLLGHQEGNAQITGVLGTTATLTAHAVLYDLQRQHLEPVRVGNAAHPDEAHNMIFLAEGFTSAPKDRELFDTIVTKVVDELFDAGVNEPYPMLKDGFNVWKAFETSEQSSVTCAYTVNTKEIALPGGGKIGVGHPIPYENRTDPTKPGLYTVDELVRIVGRPKRGETGNLGQLLPLWQQQSLTDHGHPSGLLQPGKIDEDLVAAWRAQQVEGLLEAHDTFFGVQLGVRLADRLSGVGPAPVPTDGPPAPRPNALATFVDQLYAFYQTGPRRRLTPDRRRYPPQVFRDTSDHAPGGLIMRYLDGVRWPGQSTVPLGRETVPDATAFKRSRGLVALIVHDDLIGGTNLGDRTVAAQTVNRVDPVAFTLQEAGARVMRRTPAADLTVDYDDLRQTVAHEFGHSFNLADEYEEHPGAPAGAASAVDQRSDNVSFIGGVFLHGTAAAGTVTGTDGTIDVAKVKWAGLPRMTLSARLVRASERIAGGFKVTVDRRFIAGWVEAQKQGLRPSLRNRHISVRGQQLPLPSGPTEELVSLTINGIDEASGAVLLTGATPGNAFAAGSVLYVPRWDPIIPGPATVLKERVRQFLATVWQKPLNKDTDTTTVSVEVDEPVDVPNFNEPCHPYRLIGVYEGAAKATQSAYRPAGSCKMRNNAAEFCHVCRWLIVNRVDPGLHALLDKLYPEAKKNG